MTEKGLFDRGILARYLLRRMRREAWSGRGEDYEFFLVESPKFTE